MKDDFFVIRSSETTLGGGNIIDPNARRHRRKDGATLKRLAVLQEGTSEQVLLIPFENFVVEPEPYLNRIGDLLDTKATRSTRRTLRKEKVPRRITTAGRDLPIYRRYHWQPPPRRKADDVEFQERWEKVAEEATPEGMKVLESMYSAYSERYLSPADIPQVPGNDV